MPDPEPLKAQCARREVGDDNAGDVRPARAFVEPVDQSSDSVGASLSEDFHAPVLEVADFARKSKLPGPFLTRPAKTDPLNAPAHDRSDCAHIGHSAV